MSPISSALWAGAASTAACSRPSATALSTTLSTTVITSNAAACTASTMTASALRFFSRAILEMLFYTDFEPDIINCNDWQTALTPVYLNLYYRHLDKFSRIKTVFTIHNIAYQGKVRPGYPRGYLRHRFPRRPCGGVRRLCQLHEGCNWCADKVTTVSPTYAQEILDPWFSHGLDGLLRQKRYKLCGILNGIDVDVFKPRHRPDIAKNYDAETFQDGKAVCKENTCRTSLAA